MPKLNIKEAAESALAQAKEGNKMVIDVNEHVQGSQGLLGIAAGLALAGFRPVCRADNFDSSHLQGFASLPVVIRVFASKDVNIHGIKAVAPSSPYTAKGLMHAAMHDPNAVLFLEPVFHSAREEVPEDKYTIPIGKADIVKEGSDVTLVSWGAAVKACRDAAKMLEGKIDVELVDLLTLSPLDTEALAESVRKTGRLVVAHEPHFRSLASEIVSAVCEKTFMHIEAPPARTGGSDAGEIAEAVKKAAGV